MRSVSVMAIATFIGWGFVTNTFASWLNWQGYLLFLIGGKDGAWAFTNIGVLFALIAGGLGYWIFARKRIAEQEAEHLVVVEPLVLMFWGLLAPGLLPSGCGLGLLPWVGGFRGLRPGGDLLLGWLATDGWKTFLMKKMVDGRLAPLYTETQMPWVIATRLLYLAFIAFACLLIRRAWRFRATHWQETRP